jgi:hypothetical protein
MTQLNVAVDDIRQRVDELNKQVEAYLAEGLPFSFVADPASVGVGLMAPVARVTMPTTTGISP